MELPPECQCMIFSYIPSVGHRLSKSWYNVLVKDRYSDPYYDSKISWKKFNEMLDKYPENQLAAIVRGTKFNLEFDDNWLVKYATRFGKAILLDAILDKISLDRILMLILTKIASYAGKIKCLKLLLDHPGAETFLSEPEKCASVKNVWFDKFSDATSGHINITSTEFANRTRYYERLKVDFDLFRIHFILTPLSTLLNKKSNACLLLLMKQPYLNVSVDYNYLLEFGVLNHRTDIVKAYLRHNTCNPCESNFYMYRRSAKPKYIASLELLINHIKDNHNLMNEFIDAAVNFNSKKRKSVIKCIKSDPNLCTRLTSQERKNHAILSKLL